MKTIEHPYKPSSWRMLLATLFFGVIAVFMAREALGNDRGLIINGIIELGPHGATIFYWCVAGMGAAFVLIGLPMFVIGLVAKGSVRLSETEISAPRFGFSRTSTVVPLADIRTVAVQTVQRQRFLIIAHSRGTLTILRSCLPNAAAFDEICTALNGLVGGRGKAAV